MGCQTSKLDRLPAVALCRDRCKFVDEALRQSYVLADAHVAHMHSLKALASALLSFFHQFQDYAETDNLQINGHDDATTGDRKKSPPSHSPSSSFSSDDSEARVLLHSESEPEDTDKEIQLFTETRYDDYVNRDAVSSAPDNVAFMHYLQPLYAPFSPPNYYGGYSGSKPPSPPPPPRNSAWEILNFFEPYDKYQVPYSPTRDADVATQEEEKDKGKVVMSDKPQNEAKKKGDGGGGNKVNEAEDGGVENKEAGSKEKKDLISKKKEATASAECSNSAKVKPAKGLCETVKEIQILFERASDSGNPVLEMLDVGKLRYHRKFDFNPSYPGSCKMMNVFTPSSHSNPLAVKCMEASLLGRRTGSGYQGVDKDKGHGYGNLCSTLKRLYVWEKKLYHEVKAEEKLRILHQKKCRQLRRMNKKGADAQKVDSLKTFIGILATKMKISIQVVDKISNTICKLREEELWPQISTFILMFLGMWKEMLECYRCQYQEIAEAKTLDGSTFNKKLGSGHIDAAIKLKSELQNWNLSFSDWIHAQKCHVKALNGWLVRCLLYEPEELPDDTTPFSPSKIGAPPVFVICNKWSRAVDNLSEKNVTEAVNGFMLRLNERLEKHILDLQQRLALDMELERKVKILEKQEQKMNKIVQARERKMFPIAREETDALLRVKGDHAVHHGDLVDTSDSLQSSLKRIFAAMERFTATTAGLYQDLCQQINQDNHVLGESYKIR